MAMYGDVWRCMAIVLALAVFALQVFVQHLKLSNHG
jgi:hypothetical protein